MYKKRIVEKKLEKYLKIIGGVVIEGPKWCGKTTTALMMSKSHISLNDTKSEDALEIAKVSPKSLLKGRAPKLIDEWQLAPNLWDLIRNEIDSRQEPGQFILTGSATPSKLDAISHTGIGRLTFIKMRPMSLYESLDSNGSVSLKDLFNSSEDVLAENTLDINDIAYLICRGGWPQSVSNAIKREDDKYSFEGDELELPFLYIKTLVKMDIKKVDGVMRNDELAKRILISYARNQGSQCTLCSIVKDVSIGDNQIDKNTLKSYLKALRSLFIIEDAPAWNPNLRSSTALRTSDTRYFADPSLATASLGIGPSDLLKDFKTFGLLFETLAIRDLRIYAEANDGEVYHYRDSNDLECDAVIHLRNGKYGLVEIKLGGQEAVETGIKTLLKLKDKIDYTKMNKPSFMMVLTATGRYAYNRTDGVIVCPIGCLKD